MNYRSFAQGVLSSYQFLALLNSLNFLTYCFLTDLSRKIDLSSYGFGLLFSEILGKLMCSHDIKFIPGLSYLNIVISQ
jgi:hypothetical protein